jgi:hypothetical protein
MAVDTGRAPGLREEWLETAATGAVAFVVGYAAVVAVIFAFGEQSGSLASVLELVGIVFYNAHNVPAVGGGQTVNVLAAAQNPNVPVVVYYAIPVVAVLAAGVFVGRARPGDDPTTVLHAGAPLAVGYALLAVVGSLAVSIELHTGATVSPDLVKAALFGLAYPVVFGTLGAGLGFAWRQRSGS